MCSESTPRPGLGCASCGWLVRSWCLCSPPKELEQMAKEQDKESEKQALLREVENHKKQMLRWVWQPGLLPSPL